MYIFFNHNIKENDMNEDIIQGKWEKLKGQVHKTWGKITDDEVAEMSGRYKELAGALQEKYGYDKDRTEKEIKKFVETYHTEGKSKWD